MSKAMEEAKQYAKAEADRIVTLNSLDEIATRFGKMLAFHVRASLSNSDFYTYREVAKDGSVKKVFVELVEA